MKIKKDYVLRTVASQHLVVPVGEAGVNFNGVITLNNSGKLLFEAMLNEIKKEDLVKLLLDKYEVTTEQATLDVEAFIKKLDAKKLIEY